LAVLVDSVNDISEDWLAGKQLFPFRVF